MMLFGVARVGAYNYVLKKDVYFKSYANAHTVSTIKLGKQCGSEIQKGIYVYAAFKCYETASNSVQYTPLTIVDLMMMKIVFVYDPPSDQLDPKIWAFGEQSNANAIIVYPINIDSTQAKLRFVFIKKDQDSNRLFIATMKDEVSCGKNIRMIRYFGSQDMIFWSHYQSEANVPNVVRGMKICTLGKGYNTGTKACDTCSGGTVAKAVQGACVDCATLNLTDPYERLLGVNGLNACNKDCASTYDGQFGKSCQTCSAIMAGQTLKSGYAWGSITTYPLFCEQVSTTTGALSCDQYQNCNDCSVSGYCAYQNEKCVDISSSGKIPWHQNMKVCSSY